MFFAVPFRFLPTHAVGVVVFVPQTPLTPPRNILGKSRQACPCAPSKKLHFTAKNAPALRLVAWHSRTRLPKTTENNPRESHLLLTSILPQLRHYRRLKIIATFAAAGSLESVLEAATAAICRNVGRNSRAVIGVRKKCRK